MEGRRDEERYGGKEGRREGTRTKPVTRARSSRLWEMTNHGEYSTPRDQSL